MLLRYLIYQYALAADVIEMSDAPEENIEIMPRKMEDKQGGLKVDHVADPTNENGNIECS